MVCELFETSHLQIYASQFMTSNYSSSICSFESAMCGKEGEKLQKYEYLEKEIILNSF